MSERETPKQSIDEIIRNCLIEKSSNVLVRNIKSEAFVDRGHDSLIIEFGGNVYKLYGYGNGNEVIGERKLLFYKDITNAAKDYFRAHKMVFRTGKKRYPVSINSFDNLIYSGKYLTWVGVAPFVEGDNLLDETSLNHELLIKYFTKLQEKIEKALGVSGISFFTKNAKLVNNKEIIITDICMNIANLHPDGRTLYK